MGKVCIHCGTAKELRPYGPNASWICFPCAMATPERQAITEKEYMRALDAAAEVSDVILIGSEDGPQPYLGDE